MITYKKNIPLDVKDVIEVFRSSGIRRPIEDTERIQRMLDQANLTISAWDGEQLVGIARSVTDFAYCCYLSDLAVAKEYQKKGIGQELIVKTQDSLSSDVALLLLSAPNAMSYYPHIGFTQAHHAWLLPRQT